MFGYNPMLNQQGTIDKITNQIKDLENLRAQVQSQMNSQPTNLTQNFQIAPTNRETIRYATSMEEVQKEMTVGTTPYFSKDMSVVWIKEPNGSIKTYELNEIVAKDEKDLLIEGLQFQIAELRKEIKDAKSISNDVDGTTESEKSSDVSADNDKSK